MGNIADTMEKNCIYQLVVVQNGQYGCVHKDNERMVLDHPFKTYEEALSAASRRYRMLKACPDRWDTLVGTVEEFTVSVKNTDRADFSDHYFIEEVQ